MDRRETRRMATSKQSSEKEAGRDAKRSLAEREPEESSDGVARPNTASPRNSVRAGSRRDNVSEVASRNAALENKRKHEGNTDNSPVAAKRVLITDSTAASPSFSLNSSSLSSSSKACPRMPNSPLATTPTFARGNDLPALSTRQPNPLKPVPHRPPPVTLAMNAVSNSTFYASSSSAFVPSAVAVTPKPTAFFPAKLISASKPAPMNDDMDAFFNSPTTKALQQMQLCSTRKNRPVSPSPGNRLPRMQPSTYASDDNQRSGSSSNSSSENESDTAAANFTRFTPAQKETGKDESKHGKRRESLLHLLSLQMGRNGKEVDLASKSRPSRGSSNRVLFPTAGRLGKVDLLSSNLRTSGLQSPPVKGVRTAASETIPTKNATSSGNPRVKAAFMNDFVSKCLNQQGSDGDDEQDCDRDDERMDSSRMMISTFEDSSSDEMETEENATVLRIGATVGGLVGTPRSGVEKRRPLIVAGVEKRDLDALILVFRFILHGEKLRVNDGLTAEYSSTGSVQDLLPFAHVCKVWKDAVYVVVWEAPVFFRLASMLKMHRAIYGGGDSLLGPPASAKLHRATPGSNLNSNLRGEKDQGTTSSAKKRGIPNMLAIPDPSSPRKLLFDEPQGSKRNHKSHGASTANSMSPPYVQGHHHHFQQKYQYQQLPNPKLARLVQSISFHLFHPGDRHFSPAFDVQAFFTDTFPNLTQLSLSGAAEWINPYLLARIVTNPRLVKNLTSLELSSGAMDRLLLGGETGVSSGDASAAAAALRVVPLLHKLKYLKRLIINDSHVFDDVVLKAFVAGSCVKGGGGGLEHVVLCGCRNVTVAGIHDLVTKCAAKLKVLAISVCAKVGGDLFSGAMKRAVALRTLSFAHLGPSKSDAALVDLLAGLDCQRQVNCTGKIEDFGGFGSCVRLEHLSVTGAPWLSLDSVARIVDGQRFLKTFKISECDLLPSDAMQDTRMPSCVIVS
ncbi:hypothetical protein BJ741DRAFT_647754 [Chytriomyces cf. hyalinus JEL632]|nr:hypothetical protein BJ741DRAFT_647754 [Chytriomyces cf. hyalinus JEL632]